MLDLLILNPLISLCLLLFAVGFVLLVSASSLYRKRTKKIIITPKDIMNYEGMEKTCMIYGVLLGLIGILGVMVISETYGYKRIVTDVHGIKSIESSK